MVPWGLQLLFYCFLYHAFPRDRDSSIELSRQQRVQPSSSQTGILDAAGKYIPALCQQQPDASDQLVHSHESYTCLRGGPWRK